MLPPPFKDESVLVFLSTVGKIEPKVRHFMGVTSLVSANMQAYPHMSEGYKGAGSVYSCGLPEAQATQPAICLSLVVWAIQSS